MKFTYQKPIFKKCLLINQYAFLYLNVKTSYTITFTYTLSGDSLNYHNHASFSTNDSDNDKDTGDCAGMYHGAWWYASCYRSNLNGVYKGSSRDWGDGLERTHWKNFYSIKRTVMKIRPN